MIEPNIEISLLEEDVKEEPRDVKAWVQALKIL